MEGQENAGIHKRRLATDRKLPTSNEIQLTLFINEAGFDKLAFRFLLLHTVNRWIIYDGWCFEGRLSESMIARAFQGG